MTTATAEIASNQDRPIVTVISIAHGCSHFFHLIAAPLFPWLKDAFQVSYAELGLLMTVFFIVSGIGQAMAGFVVDRIGAFPVLVASIACFVLAAVVIALAPSYPVLMLGCMLAGLGNASFHPVDFSVLNARVTPARLGKAYAAHGIAGSLGWALAPLLLVTVAQLAGWRTAVACAAVLAAIVLGIVWRARGLLLEPRHGATSGNRSDATSDTTSDTTSDATSDATSGATSRATSRAESGGRSSAASSAASSRASGAASSTAARSQADGPAISQFAFLRLPAVWMSFMFFLTIAIGGGAVQSFGPESARLLHDVPTQWAAISLTVYMLASAGGMIVGGFMISDTSRVEPVIGVSYTVAASAALVLALATLPAWAVLAMFAVIGFGVGIAGPSRDLLVRRVTPPGATGRVYGTVYSGLDTGLAIAPAIFGWLMDRGEPAAVWIGVAFFQALLIASAIHVGRLSRQRDTASQGASAA